MVITIFLSISNGNKQVDKDSKKALTINLVHYWMKFSPYELSSFFVHHYQPKKFFKALSFYGESVIVGACLYVCERFYELEAAWFLLG